MKFKNKQLNDKNERGIALITVLGLLMLAAVLTASAITVSKLTAMVTAASTGHSEAVYAAESAAARIQWYLMKSNTNSLGLLGEADSDGNKFDKEEDTEILLKYFRADGIPHTITSGGKESTIRIYDMRSGIDIYGTNPSRDLQFYKQLITQLMTENEDLTSFQDALLDYVDGDETVRLHGAEKAKYLELGLPNLPRNNKMQFREEIMLVPGAEKLFQLDQYHRLSLFRLTAPPGLRTTSGLPSIFTAGKYQIMGRCNISEEKAESVLEAIAKWRQDKTKLSESLDPDILAKVRSKFIFKESGLYTIVVTSKASSEQPPATLVFSCYIAKVPESQGTRYYQYFVY